MSIWGQLPGERCEAGVGQCVAFEDCFRKVLVSDVLLQLCPIVWEIHSCDSLAWIGGRDYVDSHLAWTLLSHAEGANASERGCGLAVCRG